MEYFEDQVRVKTLQAEIRANGMTVSYGALRFTRSFRNLPRPNGCSRVVHSVYSSFTLTLAVGVTKFAAFCECSLDVAGRALDLEDHPLWPLAIHPPHLTKLHNTYPTYGH